MLTLSSPTNDPLEAFALVQQAEAAIRQAQRRYEELVDSLEAIVWRAVLADADIAGGYALDAALLVEQHLGSGEAGKDLDAQALGLLCEPLDHVFERDHEAAVVVQVARHQPVGARRVPSSRGTTR